MPWTARYNAKFAQPILDQLIAIIQRDQASAIANVDSTLDSINEFHKGPGPRLQLPYLTLAVDSTAFVQEDWDVRHSISRLALHLDVGEFNQEAVQDKAQKYARILDQIITTSAYKDLTDFTAALSYTYPPGVSATASPPAVGTVKEIFVMSHSYSTVLVEDRTTPLMRVTLELLVDMQET